MARTRSYKKAEHNFVKYISRLCRKVIRAVVNGLRCIISGGQRKLTIMIVPHSQKRIVNFQTSVFSLIFGGIVIGGVFGSFFWFAHTAAVSKQALIPIKDEARKTQASLDVLKDETNKLLNTARSFQTALNETFASLGLTNQLNAATSKAHGDLSFLFNTQEVADGALKETVELQQLASYFDNAVLHVQEMGKLLNAQTALLSDIPSLWPIKGGIGHISMPFGQNKHPFTGRWYLHTGIDLSTYRLGDPIVATANGKVVTVEYDPVWGNYVIIKHKHGFFTRYAHMQSYRVSRGQYVQQGQVIGYIGTSGVSTGAHLHYEVHIGSDVVDPIKYLNIKAAAQVK